MTPILKIVEKLQENTGAAAAYLGAGFADVLVDAADLLVKQGERIVDLEHSLAAVLSEREYFRSRAEFYAEVAGFGNQYITVEGYKAFRGTMKIRPKTAAVPSFELSGDWLYKPETGCWYGKGSSFAADICTIVEVG